MAIFVACRISQHLPVRRISAIACSGFALGTQLNLLSLALCRHHLSALMKELDLWIRAGDDLLSKRLASDQGISGMILWPEEELSQQ